MDEDGARGGQEQLVMMSPNQIMLSISLQQQPGDGCRRPTAWLSYPFPLARHQRCVQQQNGSMTKTTFLFERRLTGGCSFIFHGGHLTFLFESMDVSPSTHQREETHSFSTTTVHTLLPQIIVYTLIQWEASVIFLGIRGSLEIIII